MAKTSKENNKLCTQASTPVGDSDYQNWVVDLKAKVRSARNKLVFSVNSQVLELYWEIGRDITEKQKSSGWGSKFVEMVAEELKQEFPEIKGFSRRNIYAMLQWYRFYSEKYQFVPHGVAQLPWGHNRLIISKIKDIDEAEFYCRSTIQNAWDRDTLEKQIENNYYRSIGKSSHNFSSTLSERQSELASVTVKDPYNLTFLKLGDNALEKTIEDELINNITKFLLELGKGFAFMGRQYKITIGENDHFIDMLFYHLELRCYIVIELKSGKFIPEYAGKLNYYLSAVDSLLRKPDDNSTIGILLCKMKTKIDVEYALRDIHKPMGVSEYVLTSAVPDEIKPQLPSAEELERGLERTQ